MTRLIAALDQTVQIGPHVLTIEWDVDGPTILLPAVPTEEPRCVCGAELDTIGRIVHGLSVRFVGPERYEVVTDCCELALPVQEAR